MPELFDNRTSDREIIKPWGRTWLVHEEAMSSVHAIQMLPGGYSSKHFHKWKDNAFVVVSGELIVCTYDQSWELVRVKLLLAGHSLSVESNVRHRIASIRETVAYEIYTRNGGSVVSENDIIRSEHHPGALNLELVKVMRDRADAADQGRRG